MHSHRQRLTTGWNALYVWRLRRSLGLSAEVRLDALGNTVSVLLMLGVLMLLAPVVMEELAWRRLQAASCPDSCCRASDSLCRASSVGGPTFAAG